MLLLLATRCDLRVCMYFLFQSNTDANIVYCIFISFFLLQYLLAIHVSRSLGLCVLSSSVFRLDALAKALSVIATATWLAGWLGGCLSQPVLYQND